MYIFSVLLLLPVKFSPVQKTFTDTCLWSIQKRERYYLPPRSLCFSTKVRYNCRSELNIINSSREDEANYYMGNNFLEKILFRLYFNCVSLLLSTALGKPWLVNKCSVVWVNECMSEWWMSNICGLNFWSRRAFWWTSEYRPKWLIHSESNKREASSWGLGVPDWGSFFF